MLLTYGRRPLRLVVRTNLVINVNNERTIARERPRPRRRRRRASFKSNKPWRDGRRIRISFFFCCAQSLTPEIKVTEFAPVGDNHDDIICVHRANKT